MRRHCAQISCSPLLTEQQRRRFGNGPQVRNGSSEKRIASRGDVLGKMNERIVFVDEN